MTVSELNLERQPGNSHVEYTQNLKEVNLKEVLFFT